MSPGVEEHQRPNPLDPFAVHIGEGWAREKSMLRHYYGVTQEEFMEMDEMQSANLLANLDPIQERNGRYMALAMWGKKESGGQSTRRAK